MDIRTDSKQACLSDYIILEGPTQSPSSLIGPKKTLCGQTLPNYPAPSILVSAGNVLKLKYHTDTSKSIKGSGFNAKVAAINPTCNKMQFEYQYGEETCNSTCGKPFEAPWTKSPRKLTTTPFTTTSTESTTSHLANKTCEEKDVLYEGNVLGIKKDIETWEECANACWKLDTCKYFSWTEGDKSCTAKDTFEGKSDQTGTVSGTKSCGELATTTPTTSTVSTPITTTIPELTNKTCYEKGMFYDYVKGQIDIKDIESWEECAIKCRLEPTCKGWNWAGPDYVEATRIHFCSLKPKLVTGTEANALDSKIEGGIRGTKECGEFVSTTPTTVSTTTRPLKNETCQQIDTHHKGTPLKSIEGIDP
eukprot:TRINITY_DN13747_c0_g1_i1.p1 TRINITY_DN13747_c0_g1~~TRINITY_DN13747_c0_g1_i1.p1  ORF type:complete len:363 (+),score=63.30 TRINITY_DN13747_c0_g1_i1:486-1574(+)